MNQDPNMNQNNFNNNYNQPMTNNIPNQNMNYNQPMTNNVPNQNMNYNQPTTNNVPNQNMNYNQPMNNGMQPQPMPTAMPTNGMYQQPMYQQPQPKKLNPITIVVPIAIILLVVVLFLVTGDNNYKKPIELYCEGMNNLDISKVNEALPEEIINHPDNSIAEDIQDMKEELVAYKANLSVSCTIEEEGQELTKEELQELSDDFQYEFNTDRIISKAYYVDVNRMFYIKYEDGETETDNEDITVTVAKIEGKWYYLDEN